MNTKCKGKPPLFQRLPRKGSLLVLLLSFVFCFAAFSMALASEPATSTAAKIQLNKAAISCDAGEAYQLNATFDSTPVSTDSAPKVTWSSSDSSVATVDANGKVTAIAHGSATITCALADNKDVSAACNITVAGNLIDAKTISEFQSPHPYNPDSRDCWRYTATPFASILVLEFDAKTFAEKDFDCIEVSGADGKLIQRFTADELASGEVYVDGNVACVRVVSDAAINEWGFAVVSVTPIVFDGWYELAGNVYYYRDNEMQKGIVDADGVLYHFDDETGAFIDVYTPPATEEVPVVVPDPEFEYPVLPDAGGPDRKSVV